MALRLLSAVQLAAPDKMLVNELTAQFNGPEAEPFKRVRADSSTDAMSLSRAGKTSQLLNIAPADIGSHLAQINDRRERLRKEADWLDVWLGQQNRSEEIYQMALNWLEANGAGYVEASMLDKLVPYALEFDGPSKAFEFLCDAQRASHGWNRFWTTFEGIRKRWEVLTAEFPARWRDFIRITCLRDKFSLPEEEMSSLPLPRGPEFLLHVGAMQEAEDLADAGVETVLALMANLTLPTPVWLAREIPADLIDVLFTRLEWPSSVIRERAASSISNLICMPEHSADVMVRLTEWLRNAKQESLTIIGLLPIAKAARKAGSLLNIDISTLKAAISRPSIASELLVSEIEGSLAKTK